MAPCLKTSSSSPSSCPQRRRPPQVCSSPPPAADTVLEEFDVDPRDHDRPGERLEKAYPRARTADAARPQRLSLWARARPGSAAANGRRTQKGPGQSCRLLGVARESWQSQSAPARNLNKTRTASSGVPSPAFCDLLRSSAGSNDALVHCRTAIAKPSLCSVAGILVELWWINGMDGVIAAAGNTAPRNTKAASSSIITDIFSKEGNNSGRVRPDPPRPPSGATVTNPPRAEPAILGSSESVPLDLFRPLEAPMRAKMIDSSPTKAGRKGLFRRFTASRRSSGNFPVAALRAVCHSLSEAVSQTSKSRESSGSWSAKRGRKGLVPG